jgi:hypothetical protein
VLIKILHKHLENAVTIIHLLEKNKLIPKNLEFRDNEMIQLQNEVEKELKRAWRTTEISPAVWEPFWNKTYREWTRLNGPTEFWRYAERNFQYTISVLTAVEEGKEINNLTINNIHMGDKFENIHNSTIYNRSKFTNSLNTIKSKYGEETAKALEQVKTIVEKSANTDAGELFDTFNEEIVKEKPKKSILNACWKGLLDVLPVIAQGVGIIEKIQPLLS